MKIKCDLTPFYWLSETFSKSYYSKKTFSIQNKPQFNFTWFYILLLVTFSNTISKAQIYTPSGAIQGASSNVLIGTPTPLLSNNANSFLSLEIKGRNATYGSRGALYGETLTEGVSAKGKAVGYLGLGTTWSANGSIQGLVGYALDVERLRVGASTPNKTSSAFGGQFMVRINNPIQSPTVGTYNIAGSVSVLDGNITSYPSKGVITAIYGLDKIKGSGTWAGFFEGRGHFSGYLGIGTINPNAMLTVNGKTAIGNQVSIPGNHTLYVKGSILTEEVKIAPHGSTDWADYVFEEDYQLMPLEEVEAFIEKEGHLHNTPSTEEIKENGGIEVGSITVNQQEKIEELFLHLIDMKKELNAVKKENETLKNRIEKLEK